MNDLLDQIVTIKALLNDLEMSIMQHSGNPLNHTSQCKNCISHSLRGCDKYKAYIPTEIVSGQQKCEGFDEGIPF